MESMKLEVANLKNDFKSFSNHAPVTVNVPNTPEPTKVQVRRGNKN